MCAHACGVVVLIELGICVNTFACNSISTAAATADADCCSALLRCVCIRMLLLIRWLSELV
jgi:hypothetical protein